MNSQSVQSPGLKKSRNESSRNPASLMNIVSSSEKKVRKQDQSHPNSICNISNNSKQVQQ